MAPGLPEALGPGCKRGKAEENKRSEQEMQRRCFIAFNPTHVQFHSTASRNQGFCIKSSPRDVPWGLGLSVVMGKRINWSCCKWWLSFCWGSCSSPTPSASSGLANSLWGTARSSPRKGDWMSTSGWGPEVSTIQVPELFTCSVAKQQLLGWWVKQMVGVGGEWLWERASAYAARRRTAVAK